MGTVYEYFELQMKLSSSFLEFRRAAAGPGWPSSRARERVINTRRGAYDREWSRGGAKFPH